jgi:hypothetical protein
MAQLTAAAKLHGLRPVLAAYLMVRAPLPLPQPYVGCWGQPGGESSQSS